LAGRRIRLACQCSLHRHLAARKGRIQDAQIGSGTMGGGYNKRHVKATTSSWQRLLEGEDLDGSRWDRVQFVKCDDLEVPEHGRVEVTNEGFYPSEATFKCFGARMLTGSRSSKCDFNGRWDATGSTTRRCWTLLEMLVIASVIFVAEVILFGGYYFCVMVPRDKTAPPLTATSFIPEDFHRRWTNEFIFDARDEASTQMQCFLVCPCCRLADTWRSAGQLPYHVGIIVTQVFCALTPCIGAYFRGNMRERFAIPGSRIADFLQWLCCFPFAAAQEARHVADVCHAAFFEEEAMRKENERRAEQERKHKEEIEHKTQGSRKQGGKSDTMDKAMLSLDVTRTSVLQGEFNFEPGTEKNGENGNNTV